MVQQQEHRDDGGMTTAAMPAPDGVAPGGRLRYAPVIGSGPWRESVVGPLVPEVRDEQWHDVSGSLREVGADDFRSGAAGGGGRGRPDSPLVLTESTHEVPEFTAGTAHMVQMLAGQFPLSALPEQALGETVGAAQALVQAAQSLLTRATQEAIDRGLPAQSGHSVPDWISTWAPGIDRPEALATARVAAAGSDERFEALSAKVADGSARVSRANVIARAVQEFTPIATAESLQALTDLMTDHVETSTTSELSRIVSRARERLVEPEADDLEQEQQASRRLLRRIGTVAGLTEWQLLLDEEGQAILTAALDPLSAPRPGPEHGPHRLDPRTASTRRADALLEIIGRGVAAADGVPQTEKAKIHVTVDHEALAGKVAGGGVAATGEHLSPGAIRRLACDAQIIPIVLGGPSEPLDVGATKRLFTPAQRSAVLLRDKGCTFPGCTMPAGWTDIHHIVHWVFGGATDLSNAAALCRRHHVIVHKYGYTATVTQAEVCWHLPATGLPGRALVDT